MNPMQCECSTWASEKPRLLFLGNGHHPKCQHYIPDVGALDMLKALVEGIEWWSAQEGGVPEDVWDAYAKAVFVTRGQVLTPRDE